jgi:hypothetical protein
MMMASNPALWIPAGSWAEWAGAVGTVGALGWGVIAWGRDRRRALDLEESIQARMVGGYTLGGGADPVLVHLINASSFPIARVEAVLIGDGHRFTVWGGREMPTMVLLPRDRPQIETVKPPANVQWRFEMAFNDDNGQRWHKYGSENTRKVSADFTLII